MNPLTRVLVTRLTQEMQCALSDLADGRPHNFVITAKSNLDAVRLVKEHEASNPNQEGEQYEVSYNLRMLEEIFRRASNPETNAADIYGLAREALECVYDIMELELWK